MGRLTGRSYRGSPSLAREGGMPPEKGGGASLHKRSAGVSADRATLASSDMDLIGAIPLFSGMSREAIQACLSEARVRAYARKRLLFSRGQPADSFFIVLDGWVKLFRDTVDGRQTVIGVFTRGQAFALAAAIRFGSYPADAEVVEHSRLLAVPAASFARRAQADAALAMNINATIGDLMQTMVAQIERLTRRSSTQRVAEFLASHCSAERGPMTVHLPHDKALVAARLGMEPETFSRCLAKLRRYGVECKGAVVHIADISVVRRIGLE